MIQHGPTLYTALSDIASMLVLILLFVRFTSTFVFIPLTFDLFTLSVLFRDYPKTYPTVLVLSEKILTEDQLSALSFGLKFAPTPKDILDPTEFFERFEQQCTRVFSNIAVGSKSHLPKVMQDRVDLMKDKLTNLKPTSFGSNISKGVRTAIEQLRRDKSLTIREADKGSCIVVMDTSSYNEDGKAHLSDTTIYKRLDHDRTQEVIHKAKWALKHYALLKTIGHYEEGNLYTIPERTRTQELYFLRKVHKNPHGIRPIVSCSSRPTEKISGYLCHLLSPHLEDVKSLVTNSQQVIQTIESLDLSQHPNVTLVSLDVESLYLSIPQAVGIEMVLQRVLPTSPPQATYKALKNLARDLLKIVIRDNTFRFHNDFYNQVKGVAMGTRCVPPFANLFLGSLEEKALAAWTGTNPLLWLRFLDDILMLWEGDGPELTRFLEHLNSQMKAINFTMNKSQESITFLDMEIYKGHRFNTIGILDIKPYKKDTNPQALLHFESCHPRSTFPTIVRGEILRILRASSDAETYTIHVTKLLTRFQERGNPKPLLMDETSSISYGDRESYLLPHPKRELAPNVTIFSVHHHPALSSKLICDALFDEETPFLPMVTRPRPTSTKDLLVKAKTPGRTKFRVERRIDTPRRATSLSSVEDRVLSPSTPP